MHDRIIEYFTNEYDEYTQSSEDYVSEGVKDFSKEMEYEWAEQLENMDSKPAATTQSKRLTFPIHSIKMPSWKL